MNVKDKMAGKAALLQSLTPTGRAYLEGRKDKFSQSLAEQLDRYGSLSPKQVDALERVATQRAMESELNSKLAPITEGRRVVTGSVVSAKYRDYGTGARATWVVATSEGKVWGTIPARIVKSLPYGSDLHELVGQHVEFEATVERSKEDPHFGLLRRPA